MTTGLIARALRRYRAGGLAGVAGAGGAWLGYWRAQGRAAHPVAWAHLGPLSRALAAAVKPSGPPVLVLGYPRSGTSWVGATLGSAPNAMYLYEPVNQSLAAGTTLRVYSIDPAAPPLLERRAAHLAFAGVPAFRDQIVRSPQQWRLAERARRKVVVKEVNPQAAGFYLRRHRPRVVLVVRHPAAVALSFRSLGWWGPRSTWRGHGRGQGAALRHALGALEAEAAGEFCVVVYEDLCLQPLERFKELFAFCGLRWEAGLDSLVQEQTTRQAAAPDASSVVRDSRRMARQWVGKINSDDLAELRAGYAEAGLPWYAADEDW